MQINCKYEKLVPATTLVEHEMNANKHPARQIEMLAKILKYQGWRHPIVVSKLSGKIVAGHGRLEAAKANGWAEVPVDMQDFDDKAQELAFLASDNKIQELAETDDDAMVALIKSTDIDDLELFGLDDFELPKDDAEAREEIEDDVPDVTGSISKLGDIYEIGSHRLVCGDSCDGPTVERLMNGEKAELWLTDPPYGVDITEKNQFMAKSGREFHGGDLKNDELSGEDLSDLWIDAARSAHGACSGKASFYFFGPSDKIGKMVDSVNGADWQMKHMLVWVKDSFVLCRSDYHYQHEPVLYGWKNKSSHVWHGDRKQSTCLFIDKPKDKQLHPSAKPINLIEQLIKNSSSPKGSVLDLFGGSGSTLIACEKTNRKCFMMELDPHYIDVIVSRWCKYTGNTSIKRNGEPMEWTLGQT